MQIAIVGCGNIAPFYMNTLHRFPVLELIGVTDKNEERLTKLSAYYAIPKYSSFEELLNDKRVELVINLTNPRSHYYVSKASLEAGKHVYSEKPLAMSFTEAKELVNLAEQKGLLISSAPSRILAETAQTMWKALREKVLGNVYLAYGEMDGGLIHRTRYKDWKNELGVPWPYKDEFETGCTIEHTGYLLTWLMAFWGPVKTVTAFSSCQIPDKQTDIPLEVNPPDFSVGCIKFASGPVARITSSWIASANHSLRIYGDDGILYTDDVWQPRSPVYIKRWISIKRKTMLAPWKERYKFASPPDTSTLAKAHRFTGSSLNNYIRSIRSRFHHLKKRVDFCLGPAELATSVEEGRPCRLSSKYCLHTTEVLFAIHNALDTGSPYKVTTSFDPMEPMPWAKP